MVSHNATMKPVLDQTQNLQSHQYYHLQNTDDFLCDTEDFLGESKMKDKYFHVFWSISVLKIKNTIQ